MLTKYATTKNLRAIPTTPQDQSPKKIIHTI